MDRFFKDSVKGRFAPKKIRRILLIQVWTPDIVLYNSAGDGEQVELQRCRASLSVIGSLQNAYPISCNNLNERIRRGLWETPRVDVREN